MVYKLIRTHRPIATFNVALGECTCDSFFWTRRSPHLSWTLARRSLSLCSTLAVCLLEAWLVRLYKQFRSVLLDYYLCVSWLDYSKVHWTTWGLSRERYVWPASAPTRLARHFISPWLAELLSTDWLASQSEPLAPFSNLHSMPIASYFSVVRACRFYLLLIVIARFRAHAFPPPPDTYTATVCLFAIQLYCLVARRNVALCIICTSFASLPCHMIYWNAFAILNTPSFVQAV